MAASMFDQSGSFVSTDPKQAEAFMRATGGQILPSSPAARRAWELSQQRAVQLQQGMAQGRQAVEALKAQQALNPQTASGLPSDRVVTSDTGFKAVLDAQGNIVGTNAAVSQPIDPRFQGVDAKGDVIAPTAAESALDRREFNQGRGTMLEKAALGPNIRDAFLAEYAKKGPVQAVAVEEVLAPAPPQPATTPLRSALGKPTFGKQPLPNDTPGNASSEARSIFSRFATPKTSPQRSYVPYGEGENYAPMDEAGRLLSDEEQIQQLVAASPTPEANASMFEAAALRKQELRKRAEREALLKAGKGREAKKLSDEIEALRKQYLLGRVRGGYGADNVPTSAGEVFY